MEIIDNIPIGPNYPFMGRRIIYTSRQEDEIDSGTIPKIINGAMQRHLKNRAECLYLKKYFRGCHPILKRKRIVREDINNRLVIPNAIAIVRNSNGYFLGEPIQFTAKRQKDAENVGRLNDYTDSEDKACGDMDIGRDASITGRGFRITAADRPEDVDEAPFEIPPLESENTEVIYSTDAGHRPMLAFYHAPILNDNGNASGTMYTVYTSEYQYKYLVQGSLGSQIQTSDLIDEPLPHLFHKIPIVEYPNNACRMGDFEAVITILDAIDKLNSDRVNDVEQIVNAILVFQGLHLQSKDEAKDHISDLDKLKESLTLETPPDTGGGSGNSGQKIYYVSPDLDQSQAEILQQTLMDYVYAVTGIPDRKDKTGGAGDTGDAVYLRDGFESLEIVARVKERYFKAAERQTLNLICTTLRRFNGIDIRPMDVDIKFVRNRTNNLLNKANAFATFMGTKQLAPEDGFAVINLSSDAKGMAERGQAYWDEQARKQASVQAAASGNAPRGDEPENDNQQQAESDTNSAGQRTSD